MGIIGRLKERGEIKEEGKKRYLYLLSGYVW
jgi:hypothetical protein